MKKRKTNVVYITLTAEQNKAIHKLREKVFEASGAGKPGILMGQIISGEMIVGFVGHEKGLKIIEIMGGKPKVISNIRDSQNRHKVVAKV